MNNIKHNIKRELDFINLFNLSLIETMEPNKWDIIDRNNKVVGYIIYKKLENEDIYKKYGYQMMIDTKDIYYNGFRAITDVNMTHYFTIKSKKYGNVKIHLTFGDEFNLIIHSEDDKHNENGRYINWINCIIDDEGLELQIKSDTENFNTYESLIYKSNTLKNVNSNKFYQYWIKYRKKPFDLDDYIHDGINIRGINGFNNPDDCQCNRMTVNEMAWIDSKQTVNTCCDVLGTVEEMAEKHDFGINAINYFRFIANEIFPFEEDVMDKLCFNLIGKREDLAIFIPEFGYIEEPKKKYHK